MPPPVTARPVAAPVVKPNIAASAPVIGPALVKKQAVAQKELPLDSGILVLAHRWRKCPSRRSFGMNRRGWIAGGVIFSTTEARHPFNRWYQPRVPRHAQIVLPALAKSEAIQKLHESWIVMECPTFCAVGRVSVAQLFLSSSSRRRGCGEVGSA